MKAEEKIYKAYLEAKANKLYFNQIKDLTNLSNSSLQNIIKKLLDQNTIKKEKTKSNTFYQIKNKKLFTLKFSEIAINKFNNLNINVKVPLRNFLEKLPVDIFSVVLFGSSSRKQETKKSDIDLLVISSKKTEMNYITKEVNAISNYPLNVFQCNLKQFAESKDPVIFQAKNTGFPIRGEQNFYEVLANEYQ